MITMSATSMPFLKIITKLAIEKRYRWSSTHSWSTRKYVSAPRTATGM